MNFGIIAAGQGSRLAQEGAAACKPMIKLQGEPMIGRLMKLMTAAGAENIAIILNPAMPQAIEYVNRLSAQLPVPVEITIKATPSSMHSFYEITRMLDGKGRFIATTVDTVFRPEAFTAYARQWSQAPADTDGIMAMTSYIDDEKPLYIETAGDNEPITAFRDTPWPGVRYISGGIYGLEQSAIRVLEQCMDRGLSRMRNFQRSLLEAGLTLRGHDMGKILDVDHVGDIDKAEAFLQHNT